MRKDSRRDRVSFLLHTDHNRKLHLYLYLSTVFFILLVYVLLVIVFGEHPVLRSITGILAIGIAITMVYRRDKIVKWLSVKILDNKRKKIKQENKVNLERTIRRVVPTKKKRTVKIGGASMKEKLSFVKNKLKRKKNKNSPDYIEVDE